jgi:hypothetical protein
VVKGFPDIMPKLPVSDEELKEIVDYLETLGQEGEHQEHGGQEKND